MQEAFSAYIRSMALFILFASLVQALVPNARYKAYIRLVLGFILLLIAVRPLGGILQALTGGGLQGALQALKPDYKTEATAFSTDARQDVLVLDIYERELYTQLDALTNSVGLHLLDADFQIAAAGERFGLVEEIWLTVSAQAKKAALIRIEPIRIQVGIQADPPPPEEPEEIAALKKAISHFYNLSTQHIHCNIRQDANGNTQDEPKQR